MCTCIQKHTHIHTYARSCTSVRLSLYLSPMHVCTHNLNLHASTCYTSEPCGHMSVCLYLRVSMRPYVCVYTYIYMQMHVYIYIYIYMLLFWKSDIHACVFVYIYTNSCVRVFVCVCIYIHIYTHASQAMRTFGHTYIHMYMRTFTCTHICKHISIHMSSYMHAVISKVHNLHVHAYVCI